MHFLSLFMKKLFTMLLSITPKSSENKAYVLIGLSRPFYTLTYVHSIKYLHSVAQAIWCLLMLYLYLLTSHSEENHISLAVFICLCASVSDILSYNVLLISLMELTPE